MTEALAIIILPCQLEAFEHEAHARKLLEIPRVLAIEPSRRRVPRFLRDALPARQVKRLRFPGEPRMLLLYHPSQYPLARALAASHEHAELWYLRPRPGSLRDDRGFTREELLDLDRLAADRAGAARSLTPGPEPEEELYFRMRELEVITHRPFVPGARIATR
jgi:hypothetical protein